MGKEGIWSRGAEVAQHGEKEDMERVWDSS